MSQVLHCPVPREVVDISLALILKKAVVKRVVGVACAFRRLWCCASPSQTLKQTILFVGYGSATMSLVACIGLGVLAIQIATEEKGT